MKKLNCITINTDASWCPLTKSGGYAFWIVCDNFRIKKSGMFKKPPESAQEAETMAMANAFSLLRQQKNLPAVSKVIINTDCMYAVTDIKMGGSKTARATMSQLGKLQNALDGAEWEFRHVKAHQGYVDKRSFVNEWCDFEAKKWMRKMRSEIRMKQN